MMRKLTLGVIGALVLAPWVAPQQMSNAIRSELAPSGKLRAGINFGNALLTARDPNGAPRGIAVDLAMELGRRAGVPVEVVAYDSAATMADGAKAGAWDVAFLAADPARAGEIDFTAPYVEIDSTYLVPAGSPLRALADVDRDGVRIAAADKSAYDLFLTRTLSRARLVRVPGVDGSVDLFISEKLDALAGLKPLLVDVAARLPGSRVLDGRFTTVRQAAGVPKGRTGAARYVREFIEDAKASGLVAKTIARHGVRGLTIAAASQVHD
jgi:polar amino acid transport system substrate-binding protein